METLKKISVVVAGGLLLCVSLLLVEPKMDVDPSAVEKEKSTVEDDEKDIKEFERKLEGVEEEKEVEPIKEEEPETSSYYYASTSLNLRTGSNARSHVYKTVPVNTELQISDSFDDNGWKKVLSEDRELYVNGKYLSKTKVDVPVPKPEAKPVAPSGNHDPQVNSEGLSYIGNFKITHYAGDTATSTGAVPTVGRTIAVDPNVIPYGSRVVINGHVYVAEDCGGAIKGNKIDIFVASESEAYQKGVYYTDVYWA